MKADCRRLFVLVEIEELSTLVEIFCACTVHTQVLQLVMLSKALHNYLNGRFRGAVQVYNQTKKKYGKNNVEITGHSLGGSQAMYIGRRYGLKGKDCLNAVAYRPSVDKRSDSSFFEKQAKF